MFEAMAGNFAHPEDIQLFLNVLNGSMALHAGDSVILRDDYSNLCVETFTQLFFPFSFHNISYNKQLMLRSWSKEC